MTSRYFTLKLSVGLAEKYSNTRRQRQEMPRDIGTTAGDGKRRTL